MEGRTGPVTAHKGLKAEILLELKKNSPLAAKELAELYDVSVTAIRRHLKELEAEGLIQYGVERHGAGAPAYVYRLSVEGESIFPRQYEKTLTRLLEHVVEREGRSAAASVVEEQYRELRRQLPEDLAGSEIPERVEQVARVLADAGFMAETSDREGALKLVVHNCVLHAVASRLPEICDTELSFLRDALNTGVARESHMMDGCNSCEYLIDLTRLGQPERTPDKTEE